MKVYNTDGNILIRQLTEKNVRQASMIMELQQEVRTMKKIVDVQEEEDNIVPFQSFGGRKPPGNWLMAMETGTIFLCRDKNDKLDYTMPLFQHGGANGDFVLIIENVHGNMDMKWADPVRFCNRFDLAQVIATPDELKKEKDGKSISPPSDDSADDTRTQEGPEA